jgi:hypothetical protein
MTSTSGPNASVNAEVTTQARSCQKCNQRKTRCSKTQPCTSCVKLGIECIFPPPGRAPRRKKRALKAELVSKVKSLEQKVRELADERNSPQSDAGANNEEASTRTIPQPLTAHAQHANHPTTSVGDHLEGRFGQLMVDGDSSRYVNHEALASFRTDVSLIMLFSTSSSTNGTARLARRASPPFQTHQNLMMLDQPEETIQIHSYSDIGLWLTHSVTCIQRPSSARHCGVHMRRMSHH